ncbi:hypothetical protein M231_07060 [Tremella mesenterica]|uniref:tRNA (adenine(58)-N(1))-methyltransferase catalytic subunit TRM61 n=1 Tax=Tremella mesenterica TaxID=5217 RepID=A0A4Q1BCC8_TREME|nr:hypothetical protein M231_07060 [Tremella mesenterica]
MTSFTVTPGDTFHNKFGRYAHNDMIGVKFGSKLHSPSPQSGYIYLLRPTPELWTLSLPHRTQILYMPDIAYITMRLGVRVGGTVIEAGTGSGSMTHSLSRSVGPRGEVYSYEYHETRYKTANVEFTNHRLDNVKLSHRNVCKDGFGDVSDVEAVFLDLPAPWDAIPHVMKILRPDIITKICCFSPCLEQVLKTVSTLRAEGFSDVSTQEVLVRTHDLVTSFPPGSSHLKNVTETVERLKEHEERKERRRVLQIKAARERPRKGKEEANQAIDQAPDVGTVRDDTSKVSLAEEEAVATSLIPPPSVDGSSKDGEAVASSQGGVNGEEHFSEEMEDGRSPKRRRMDHLPVEIGIVTDGEVHITRETKDVINGKPRELEDRDQPNWNFEEPKIAYSQILTKPAHEMRGHTSYLTFASFYPLSIRQAMRSQEPTTQSRATGGMNRVAQLAKDESRGRGESQETEYGSEGLDEVLGTMTEEEMKALAGDAVTGA